jgi:phytoene desaturase
MKSKNILVVGAGIGGLATALRLVKKGYNVEILEKNNQAGGRLNQVKKDGFIFDTGPSFFSMSYEFEEFARDCNIKLPFKYFELDPLYSVNFSDNPKTFHLYKDIEKLARQFEGIESGFQDKFERYIKKAGSLFNDTFDPVIKTNFNSFLHYVVTLMRVNPVHLPVLFKSFYNHVKKYFSSKEAIQIISLVAFFLGRTPFDTMAIYSLLSYTEFKHDGYYNVKGGMYKIVEGLVDELIKENVRIHYNVEIVDFTEKKGQLESFNDQKGVKL